MLFYFIFIIIILVVLTYLKSPHFKGKMGELMVAVHVDKALGDAVDSIYDASVNKN